jgi:hypothetical protein
MSDEILDGKSEIPLNLPKEELLALLLMAHERDMTFNDFVEEALRNFLVEVEKNPEAYKNVQS